MSPVPGDMVNQSSDVKPSRIAAKVAEVIDPGTGTLFARGTSASVMSSVGLTFEHLWKL
jgi:hypothetical protein